MWVLRMIMSSARAVNVLNYSTVSPILVFLVVFFLIAGMQLLSYQVRGILSMLRDKSFAL